MMLTIITSKINTITGNSNAYWRGNHMQEHRCFLTFTLPFNGENAPDREFSTAE
jgi:hypothetical protein